MDGLIEEQTVYEYGAIQNTRQRNRRTEEVPRNYRMMRRNPAQVYYCAICDKHFKYPSKISEHIRKHTGEKPFVCTICGQGFTQKHTLKTHLSTHSQERPFKCSYCENCYSELYDRDAHEQTHMNDETNFVQESEVIMRDDEPSTSTHQVYSIYECPLNCGFQSDEQSVMEHISVDHHNERVSEICWQDVNGCEIVLNNQQVKLRDKECEEIVEEYGAGQEIVEYFEEPFEGDDGHIVHQEEVHDDGHIVHQEEVHDDGHIVHQEEVHDDGHIVHHEEVEDVGHIVHQEEVHDVGSIVHQEEVHDGPDMMMQEQPSSVYYEKVDERNLCESQEIKHEVLDDVVYGNEDIGIELNDDMMDIKDQIRLGLMDIKDHMMIPSSSSYEDSMPKNQLFGQIIMDDTVHVVGDDGEEQVRVLVNPNPPKKGKRKNQTLWNDDELQEMVVDASTLEMAAPVRHLRQGLLGTAKKKKATKKPRNLDWIIDAVSKGLDVDSASPHRRKKPQIHKCEYCGKVDKYPSKIKAHMRTHTGEKPHRCEICGKCFAQRTPMRLHLRRHLNQKPYECIIDGCNKRYVSGALLKIHVESAHLNKKKYVCIRGCGRVFSSSHNQRAHEMNCMHNSIPTQWENGYQEIDNYEDDDEDEDEGDEEEYVMTDTEGHDQQPPEIDQFSNEPMFLHQ